MIARKGGNRQGSIVRGVRVKIERTQSLWELRAEEVLALLPQRWGRREKDLDDAKFLKREDRRQS